ncbi:MAG: serine hydrolase domain-containing protein [Thermomicrobiales bacterium]
MSSPLPEVDALFAEWDKPDAPGCALGIVRDSALVYARGYGMANLDYGIPITPASVFHVASLSKQFTAMCILALAAGGKLTLDDDIRRYLPEIPDYGQTITIRHLILHTSGLRDQWELLRLAGWREDDLITNGDVLAVASRQRELNFAPGAQWLYSNTGYTLMALIVERLSGQSLRAFADATIFQPLMMAHTHFHDDHTMIVPSRAYGYQPRDTGGLRISIPVFDTVGATSLFTTVEDLARWARNWEERRVGSDLLDQMVVPGVLNSGERLTYGIGLMIEPYRSLLTIGHGGADAGYRAHFLRFPEQGCAIIILGNLSTLAPGLLARRVADVVLAEHFTQEPERASSATDAYLPSAANLSRAVGLYRHAPTGKIYRVSCEGGKLTVDDRPPAHLVPVAPGRFKTVDTPLDMTLTIAEDGTRALRERVSGGEVMAFASVDAAAPTAEQLASYPGVYHSDELDVAYTIAMRDDDLVLRRRKVPDSPLRPTIIDQFINQERLQIAFERDEDGQVSGFTIFTGRIRNLRFARQPE